MECEQLNQSAWSIKSSIQLDFSLILSICRFLWACFCFVFEHSSIRPSINLTITTRDESQLIKKKERNSCYSRKRSTALEGKG